MAMDVTIDGVNVNAYTRRKTVWIDKDGARESAKVQFLDRDLTASAFRPALGAALKIKRVAGTILEFGGPVSRVTDRRLDGGVGGGTVTVVEATGWDGQADEVHVLEVYFPEQTLYERAHDINARWMAAKGWTTLPMTPTGGPLRPAKVYRNVTIRQILDAEAEDSGVPWRVNGDQWFAFVYLGEIASPSSFTDVNSIVLRDAEWTQEQLYRATRLTVTTGGSREWFPHWEDNVAPGTQDHFPSIVLPPEITATVSNSGGYAAGATSLVVSGLPPSFTIRAGVTLRAATHGPYTLASACAADASGNGTLALSAGLTEAVEDSQPLTFERGAAVELFVNGVATALDGTTDWSYDSDECQLVNAAGPPVVATVVRYQAHLQLPATVRVWDAIAKAADGSFDYAHVRDAVVSWPQYDRWESAWLDAADAAARELVNRSATPPKDLHLRTLDTEQYYPWMGAPCSFPTRLIDGSYTIQRVTLSDVGRANQDPHVEIWLNEGRWVKRPWGNYWTGGPTAPWQGAEPLVLVSHAVIEVLLLQQHAQLTQAVIETAVRNTGAEARLAQTAIEVMVA